MRQSRGVGALGHARQHEARRPATRRDDGRSLAECTAISARPSSTASCTSVVNTPRPASSRQRTIGAPVAFGLDDHDLGVTAETGGDGVGLVQRQGAATRCDAQRADASSSIVEVEQVANARREPFAGFGPCGVLEPHGRFVQAPWPRAPWSRHRRASRCESSSVAISALARSSSARRACFDLGPQRRDRAARPCGPRSARGTRRRRLQRRLRRPRSRRRAARSVRRRSG